MNKKRQMANITGIILTALSLIFFLFTGFLYALFPNLCITFAITLLFTSGFTFGTGQSLIIIVFLSDNKTTKSTNCKK